jgi:hypothetical protein
MFECEVAEMGEGKEEIKADHERIMAESRAWQNEMKAHGETKLEASLQNTEDRVKELKAPDMDANPEARESIMQRGAWMLSGVGGAIRGWVSVCTASRM